MGDKQELKRKVKRMHDEISEEKEKRKVLREMELFVLDNSLRESTVGQLRGHTIENKWKIYEQVKVLFYFETRTASTIFKDVCNSATLANGQSSFSLEHLSNRPSTFKRLYGKSCITAGVSINFFSRFAITTFLFESTSLKDLQPYNIATIYTFNLNPLSGCQYGEIILKDQVTMFRTKCIETSRKVIRQ